MSYDVSIGDYSGNYTFNLAKLFHEHIEKSPTFTGIQCLHGLKGKEAEVILSQALISIQELADRRPSGTTAWSYLSRRYDPDNAWGDCLSAVLWIAGIMRACRAHPRSKINVGC